jgi:hypothetical protein
VVVVPYIENNKAAIKVYKKDRMQFWRRVFTLNDDFNAIQMLVCDGAHRRKVSIRRALLQMRAKFLEPDISIGEIVSTLN